MTASGGGGGAGHVLLIGITQAAEARVKKVAGAGVRISSLFGEKCYGSLKIEADDGEKQAREFKKLLGSGTRLSQLLIVVLPFAKLQKELRVELDALSRRGAQVELMEKGLGGLPSSLGSLDQKFHEAMASGVTAVLRRWGVEHVGSTRDLCGSGDPQRTVKLKLLQGLVSHKKWGEYNHSSEDDFWCSRGKNLSSSERQSISQELIDLGLVGTKVNDGDNGKGLRYFLKPEMKGLLVELYPELKAYT